MKIVQINSVCGQGSTGKICVAVSHLLTERGIENYILYASGKSNEPAGRRYMTDREVKWQALRSRILGNYGFNTRRATKRLLRELDSIRPDIVHLHNLHGHNVHLELLCSYLKERKIKVFWTFHDCWAFTGYCPHYDMAGCAQWKTQCETCIQRRHYSWFWDRSAYLYRKKREALTGLDMTIITPSQWLADQVKQSILKEYPVRVIHNGINLEVFRPRESDFRSRYGLEGRFMILGVAFGWGPRKGLDVFIELAKRLDESYRIVLVGTDDAVDRLIPENILSIHRTQNQVELAEIYTAADLFVNPTREENYPTTHMEALACGTPVLSFRTGGCAEMLDESCGAVVPKNDVDALERMIRTAREGKPFTSEDCVAMTGNFGELDRFMEYVMCYEN